MRIVLEVVLVLAAIPLIAMGIWQLARPKLPSWMKGMWAWPLGENLTTPVAHLIGWASVLTGAACVPTVVVLALWDRSTATVLAMITTTFFAGAATFAMAWSVAESRRKPALPPT